MKRFLLALLLVATSAQAQWPGYSFRPAGGGSSSTAVGDITGLGTGVATALAVNVGSAGAPVVLNGALGTPSSGVATNLTGTAAGLTAGAASAVAVGGITGLGTGVATALAVNIGSAGAPVVNGGALGTPSSGTLTNATGLPAAGVVGTAAILTGNAFTGSNSTTLSIAATSTDGHVLQNTTAAAAGAQQWSPRLRLTGQGWKTTATAASKSVDWIAEVQPVQGTTAPTSNLVLSSQVDGGGYTARATFASDGAVSFGGVTGSTIAATGQIRVSSGNVIGFTNGASSGSVNAYFGSLGAAIIVQGGPSAASPVAQTLQAQGSRSGTDTNVAGASYTIRPGAGTGDATPGALIFQTYVPVASGTGAQTATTTLTLNNATTTATGSFILATSATPAAADACTAGRIAWGADYIYVCTASGAWKRAALTGSY